MKPETTAGQKISLVLLGLVTGLLLIEGGLRLAGRALLLAQEHRNRAALAAAGGYRILCLGESTTQGQWPPFLEAALNSGAVKTRFTVIDEGRGGTNTDAILASVEAHIEKYRPDMVVAMMGINDQGALHLPAEARAASGAEKFFRSLKVYKLFRFLFHASFRAEGWKEPAERPLRAELPAPRPLRRTAAMNELENALRKDPADASAGAALGWLYLRKYYSQEAADQFREVLRTSPGDPAARAGLGWTYLERGDFRRAEEEFDAVLAAKPSADMALAGLARVCLQRDDFVCAQERFATALRINPDNTLARAWLGRAYMKQDRFAAAEEQFERAVRQDPENDTAHVGLAWILQRRGRLAAAEEHFRAALRSAPLTEAHIGLGQIYLKWEQPRQAREQFLAALAAEPGNDTAYNALLSLGDAKGTVGEYSGGYRQVTARNYRALKALLDRKKIRLVCVQYPMRSVTALRNMLGGSEDGVIFVDNEKSFAEAVEKEGRRAYFKDMFGGNFGHCTPKGNALLGGNIAKAILGAVPGKSD